MVIRFILHYKAQRICVLYTLAMVSLWLVWFTWLAWHFLGCFGSDNRCSTWMGGDGNPLSLCNLKADYGTANAGVAFFGALLVRRVYFIQQAWERRNTTGRGAFKAALWLLRHVQIVSFAWFTIGMMRKDAPGEEVYFVHTLGAFVYYAAIAAYYSVVVVVFGKRLRPEVFSIISYFLLYFVVEQVVQNCYNYHGVYPWSRILVQSSLTAAIPLCAHALILDGKP